MLRCAQYNLNDDTLGGMTIGMVYDLMIEDNNDHETYPYKAVQADIDKFFGGDI